MRDVSHWLRLPPVRVFGKTIDVRRHVEHQLDVTFYNLNTVALFDWQTYGEMRNLALDKYGLELMETHLPAQTLEQGNLEFFLLFCLFVFFCFFVFLFVCFFVCLFVFLFENKKKLD